MDDWKTHKDTYIESLNTLNKTDVTNHIKVLNSEVAAYINLRGSIENNVPSANANAQRISIDNQVRALEDIKNGYSRLNTEIITFVSAAGDKMNLTGKLTENGKLQQDIKKLEIQNNELTIDVESAIARDEILRSKDNISRHNLFILDRPIRRGLIPYLWAIGVLFIGIGLIVFKMTMPVVLLNNNLVTIFFILKEFFTNKMVLGSFLVSTLIIIFFLILKIAGVFGK